MIRRPPHTVLVAALAPLGLLAVAHAGPLDPPAGPVSPTFKTINEVEPRIALSATNTPGDGDSIFRITQPGSYYLTGNLTGVPAKTGIEINVGNSGQGVTLDLMGFELVGVAGSLDGITVLNGTVAIRNGTVRSWGGDGIDASTPQHNRLADLRVQSNGGRGIIAADMTVITACTARSNGAEGILTGPSSTVTDCTAKSNTGSGISVGLGSTIARCTTVSNSSNGIIANNTCIVTDCTAVSNTLDGIGAGLNAAISNCAADSNLINGINVGTGASVTGCTARNNAGSGIQTVGSASVTGCTVVQNIGNGLSILGSNGLVTRNLCSNNGVSTGLGSGIYTTGVGSRIEGNTVMSNDFGIFVDGGSSNMVVGNYSRANPSGNYSASASNFVGTIITTSATMNTAVNSLINVSIP